MKKRWLIPILAIFLVMGGAIGAFAATKYGITFNNSKESTPVKIVNKEAYVPLEDAVKWFGGSVQYDSKTKTYQVIESGHSKQVKSHKVNYQGISGPITLKIKRVIIDPNYYDQSKGYKTKAVLLDIEVKNNSKKKVFFRPVDSYFSLSTKERFEGGVDLNQISGEFAPNAKKSGRILLEVKNTNVKSMEFKFFEPTDEKNNTLGKVLISKIAW